MVFAAIHGQSQIKLLENFSKGRSDEVGQLFCAFFYFVKSAKQILFWHLA